MLDTFYTVGRSFPAWRVNGKIHQVNAKIAQNEAKLGEKPRIYPHDILGLVLYQAAIGLNQSVYMKSALQRGRCVDRPLIRLLIDGFAVQPYKHQVFGPARSDRGRLQRVRWQPVLYPLRFALVAPNTYWAACIEKCTDQCTTGHVGARPFRPCAIKSAPEAERHGWINAQHASFGSMVIGSSQLFPLRWQNGLDRFQVDWAPHRNEAGIRARFAQEGWQASRRI